MAEHRCVAGQSASHGTAFLALYYSAGQSKSTNLMDHLPRSQQVIGKLLNDGKGVFTSKWFIWHEPISLKLKNKFLPPQNFGQAPKISRKIPKKIPVDSFLKALSESVEIGEIPRAVLPKKIDFLFGTAGGPDRD
jgi:hypothetical protein